MPGAAPVNTGDPELDLVYFEAERRVLEIQAKLHRWAREDSHRRFDDLFNHVVQADLADQALEPGTGHRAGP